jgi:hypothetical protein
VRTIGIVRARLNVLPRRDLEPRSSHHMGIFFEVPKAKIKAKLLRQSGEKRIMTKKLSEDDRALLLAEFERLSQEHRDLDAAIEALLHLSGGDRLQIQRLKKRKLALRDRLAFLEDQLTPDIIA